MIPSDHKESMTRKMEIRAELVWLDELISAFRQPGEVDANATWERLEKTLADLVTQAKNFGLPWGMVSQDAGRLREDLGILLGKRRSDGHTAEQHLVWALGAMDSLRSDHAFGPALDRLDESPSGSIH